VYIYIYIYISLERTSTGRIEKSSEYYSKRERDEKLGARLI
jgi:hypothetical protein